MSILHTRVCRTESGQPHATGSGQPAPIVIDAKIGDEKETC